MPLLPLDGLPDHLPAGGRLFGLDVGEKTVGMAVSDSGLRLATSCGTIRRTRFTADATALFAAMDERGASGLVIGLPRNMDGTEGPRVQSVRQFGFNLLALRDLPLAFWDERLSTAAVERAMIAADLSRAKRARRIDSAAAAYILQGALDALQWSRPG